MKIFNLILPNKLLCFKSEPPSLSLSLSLSLTPLRGDLVLNLHTKNFERIKKTLRCYFKLTLYFQLDSELDLKNRF